MLNKLKKPKKPANPFLMFLQDKKDDIQKQNPNIPVKELTKLISELWNKLPETNKLEYINKYSPQIENYRKEIQNFKIKNKKILKETKEILKKEELEEKDKTKYNNKKKFQSINNNFNNDLFFGRKKIKITGDISFDFEITLQNKNLKTNEEIEQIEQVNE